MFAVGIIDPRLLSPVSTKMLRRFGQVVWWFGALSLLVALALFAGAAWKYYRFSQVPGMTVALNALYAQDDILFKRYPSRDAYGGAVVRFTGELPAYAPSSARREYKELHAREDSLWKERESAEFAKGYALTFAVLSAGLFFVTIFAWAVAYILGGTFWRPSVVRH